MFLASIQLVNTISGAVIEAPVPARDHTDSMPGAWDFHRCEALMAGGEDVLDDAGRIIGFANSFAIQRAGFEAEDNLGCHIVVQAFGLPPRYRAIGPGKRWWPA